MSFTILQLIAEQDADIRNQTAPSSITKGNVTDCLNDITTELLARGSTRVATTADLSTLEGANFVFANVDNYGLFYYSAVGVPNGTTIFAAMTTGVYILYISTSPAVAVNLAGQKVYSYFNLF